MNQQETELSFEQAERTPVRRMAHGATADMAVALDHGESDTLQRTGIPGPEAMGFPPVGPRSYPRAWRRAPREIPSEETGVGYALVRESSDWSKSIPEDTDPEIREALLDPLESEEIERLAYWAEHPDLADPNIAFLPEQKSNNRIEDAFLRTRKAGEEGSEADPSTYLKGWMLPVRIRG